jgi:NhaP-type Na+/H+ or K+/H+ antiporter
VVDLTVLAAVVFAFGLVSQRLEGTVLTTPIVFVVAGFVLGPAGLGLVEFKLDDHTVLFVGEIALAILLFTHGFHFLSVGLAVGAATLTGAYSPDVLGWLLVAFAATATYLLILGLENAAADLERRRM